MAESEDLRAFIRDLMARFDRGMDAVFRKQEVTREENRRYFEALDRRAEEEARRTDEIVATLAKIAADSRAHRDALFRILDRMDKGGPATEAG